LSDVNWFWICGLNSYGVFLPNQLRFDFKKKKKESEK